MTIDALPSALQPWRPWLQWFEPELAAQVGDLVQRLHPLLGRFHGERQGGEPEPLGLDDLRQRGPYERLLTSEWLLADELPDEFLRRAVSGEHLFLAPRPKARQADRLIVGIFDAGSLQLGAPRLAQLALWILLARRARQFGGELRWGVLQSPGALHEAHTPQDLQKLLAARSFEPAGASQWASWQETLSAHSGLGECWLVSPQPLSAGWRDPFLTHHVRALRSLQADTLDVTLHERKAQRALQLPLPAPATALPLLKGMFVPQARTDLHQHHDLRLAITRAPLLSLQGTLVAVPLLDEPGAVLFPIPRAADRKQGKPRRHRWAAGAQPLAAVVNGKQFGALLSDATHLYFWQMQRFPVMQRPEREQFDAPPGVASWLRAAWLRQTGRERLCVLDKSRRLVAWTAAPLKGVRSPPDIGMRTIDTDVRGLAQWGDGELVFAVRCAGWVWVRRLSAEGSASPMEPVCETPDDPEVLFAGGRLWARGGRGACAVRLASEPQERWRINEPVVDATQMRREGPAGQPVGFQAYEVTLPAGFHAAGLVHDVAHGRFALVTRSPDSRSLFLLGDHVNEPLYTAPAKLTTSTMCPNTGLIAMLTIDRQLIVYSVPERTARIVMHAGGQEKNHDAAD